MSKTLSAPADALSAEVERAAANREAIDCEYTTKKRRLDYEIDAEISTAMADGDRNRANALLAEKTQIREALPLLEDASRKASSIHDAALAARARRDAPTLAADHRYGVATRWNAWVAEGLKSRPSCASRKPSIAVCSRKRRTRLCSQPTPQQRTRSTRVASWHSKDSPHGFASFSKTTACKRWGRGAVESGVYPLGAQPSPLLPTVPAFPNPSLAPRVEQ